MPKSNLTYLKEISEALRVYNDENENIDFELIQKIYGYASNLENLSEEEKRELDDFIAANTFSIRHLASLYLDEAGRKNLNHQLARMAPIQMTKPQSHIKLIKGSESALREVLKAETKVKVLCKTRKKYRKAA